MAFNTVVRASDRWLDEILIVATKLNDGADLDDGFALPAGTGDVAIMEWAVVWQTIATLATGVETMAVTGTIVSASSTVVDIAGSGRILRGSTAARCDAFVQPDALVLWRQDELFGITAPEIDTNASPTGDVIVRVKCVRVRPVETIGGPIQLVR